MKKEWTKPKLVSLYRGRPEESVLSACKDAGGVPGPDGLGVNCDSGGANDCLEQVTT
jgi:hypothetical protein